MTLQLPWFLRDPAVTLIGETCYVSLVENLHITDVDCIKHAISKGLGLGIVVGGSIMKIPQIALIVTAQSARGLSFPAYVLETLSYAITLAYAYRHHFPFSTYGENLFLTVQNAFITVLIVYYPSSRSARHESKTFAVACTVLATFTAGYLLFTLPQSALKLLQLSTLPLSALSKFPQILSNHRARSTGQLSTFAVGSQIAGCLARLFTTAQEVGDRLLFGGFALALVLNCVLGAQMWMYWGKDVGVKEKEDLGRFNTPVGIHEKPHVDIVVPPKSPLPQVPAAPQPGARKWARKVD
ncbi:mannose-P-dolichol utilization defect 1 protein [Rickenella mellea]|uniref:Mannose-P-dolichol utilization defect 1 protein homolog n=1 Tax=Rickenella mellea TaxID=50990 RepID=A0A4Y7PS25_9AGAM|nr:mannose-P-dolichol utilization defect 1 protein [Rickenella mellea]